MKRDDKQVVLRDAENKEIVLAAEDVEARPAVAAVADAGRPDGRPDPAGGGRPAGIPGHRGSDDMIRPATPADVPTIARLIRDLAEYERLAHEVVLDEADLRDAPVRPAAVRRGAARRGRRRGRRVRAVLPQLLDVPRPARHLPRRPVRDAGSTAGRGTARRCCAALAKLAVERGCGRLEWSVLNWNEPSIQFYKSLGAKPMDEWTVYRLTGEPFPAGRVVARLLRAPLWAFLRSESCLFQKGFAHRFAHFQQKFGSFEGVKTIAGFGFLVGIRIFRPPVPDPRFWKSRLRPGNPVVFAFRGHPATIAMRFCRDFQHFSMVAARKHLLFTAESTTRAGAQIVLS